MYHYFSEFAVEVCRDSLAGVERFSDASSPGSPVVDADEDVVCVHSFILQANARYVCDPDE